MGTDIHPAVEVRRKGIWRYHRPTTECKWYAETWDDQTKVDQQNKRREEYIVELAAKGQRLRGWPEVKIGDRRNTWDRCKARLPEAFHNRNYAKFAVLGDVRNGFGFAGVETFEPLPAISVNRGRPADISKEAEVKLSNEHSDGWVTLQELLDYDFARPLHENGVVSEYEFLACMIQHRDPRSWSGSARSGNIVTLTPEDYLKLFGEEDSFGFRQAGTRKYDATKSYHIKYAWQVPLATAVPDILEMIEYLKPLVPKDGTPDDVRVVFDFDS